MELPNWMIDGKYYYVDGNNDIIREATEEEAKALEISLIVDAQEEARRPLTEAEVLQMLIPQQINSLSVDDNTAMRMKSFYPEWVTGIAYSVGFKVQRNDKLWRVVQAHTSQVGWEPENVASLWEQINETHRSWAPSPPSRSRCLRSATRSVCSATLPTPAPARPSAAGYTTPFCMSVAWRRTMLSWSPPRKRATSTPAGYIRSI